MKKIIIIIFTLSVVFFLMMNRKDNERSIKKESIKESIKEKRKEKRKVLYIDSYDTDFYWVREITKGILETFNITMDEKGELNNENSNIELKIIHMDTKRNKSEEFKKEAALKAKKVIEDWKPELVIASDDNASKYLIVPYYKDAELPFVFCAVNWDVSSYGFPFKNVTGMIEVQLIPEIILELSKYSKGEKIGFIKGDSLSTRKEGGNFEKILGKEIQKEFVSSFEEWKKAYIKLQDEVDILLVGTLIAINDWDKNEEELREFLFKNTKIPTGAWDEELKEEILLTISNRGKEHGEWAANTALRILDGESPENIEIIKNKKASIYLNMELAKKLKIKFPIELIEKAHIVGEE